MTDEELQKLEEKVLASVEVIRRMDRSRWYWRGLTTGFITGGFVAWLTTLIYLYFHLHK